MYKMLRIDDHGCSKGSQLKVGARLINDLAESQIVGRCIRTWRNVLLRAIDHYKLEKRRQGEDQFLARSDHDPV